MVRNICVILTALAVLTTTGIAIEDYGVEGEDYIAGEVVIKFTEPVEVTELGGICYTGIPEVDALNVEYTVYEMEQLCPEVSEVEFNTCNGKWDYSDFVDIRDDMGMGNIYCLTFNSLNDAADVAEVYNGLDVTEYAHPDGFFELAAVPVDEFYYKQWNLHQSEPYSIKAEHAWDVTTGDSDVIVAVIDSGIWEEHEDFDDNRFAPGYNYVGPWYDTSDYYGHGTSVASIIGASTAFPWEPATPFNTGIAGIDDECFILPLKVSNLSLVTAENIAQGIYGSVYFGAWVVNMSLGKTEHFQVMEDACVFAYRNGRLLIAASGNEYNDGVCYPAFYSEVVAVGATDMSGYRHGYSNYGPNLELVAPSDIPSFSIYTGALRFPPDRYYKYFNGTSASAPVVSGVAALIWAHHPNWTNIQVRKKMQGSTTIPAGKPPGWNQFTGWGIINATKALDATGKGGVNGDKLRMNESVAADTSPEEITPAYLTSANPVLDSVVIKFTTESGRYSVEAYDIRGRKVEEWTGNGRDVEINWDINTSGIASGVYLIKVDTGEKVSVLKTVITR